MVQKRPSAEEELNEVSSKHPRQLEPFSQLVSALEFPCEATFQTSHASGLDDKNSVKCKPELDGNFDGIYTQSPPFAKQDEVARAPDILPCSSWASGSSSEEDMNCEAPLNVFSPTDFHNLEYPPRRYVNPRVRIYSSYMNDPPRKPIPIGPEFQAALPEYVPRRNLPLPAVDSVDCENSKSEMDFAGKVVTAMPDLAGSEVVGVGRTDCVCKDARSIRCVQQHIMEARKKLKVTLGMDAFAELGFGDMGEAVAEKWSDAEEQLFQDVVYSNPQSLRKNFWYHLGLAFPSRTKKEIVGYYFNVFMLRKRAGQNRCDALDIDSDNDEWEEIDESSDDEDESEEDDNRSPLVTHRNESYVRNVDGYDEYQNSRNIDALQEVPSMGQQSVKADGLNIQDGSCTSAEIAPKDTVDQSDGLKQRTGIFGDFAPESYNTRDWDVGYLSCLRNEDDLLPTCSMIEEVFGAGSWDYNAGDGM